MPDNIQKDETDEHIVQKVQSGDSEAFGVLVERYEGKLLSYGRRFLRDYSDVEDAVQNAFIKAYTNINSFDSTRKFSSWMYRIAHNTFINVIRKSKREPVHFFEPDVLFNLPIKGPDHNDELETKQSIEQLEDQIQKLSPLYREPLVLHYLEELSYKEISTILKIPVSTVGVRIKRARDFIKNK